MIWRLAVQQARAGRGYFAWAAAMLAVAVAFVGFAGFQVHTQRAADELSNELGGWTYERNTWMWPNFDEVDENEFMGTHLLEQEAREVLARADEARLPYTATRTAFPVVVGDGSQLLVAAAHGDHAYGALGVERLPGPGEVVLAADAARRLGLATGDTVTLAGVHTVWLEGAAYPDAAANRATQHDFTVVTVMGTPPDSRITTGVDALLAWDDTWSEDSVFTELWETPGRGAGANFQTASIHLSWPGPNPVLDAAAVNGIDGTFVTGEVPSASWVAALGALATSAAVILMAFALGRTQAQRRLQWVATARTLGAEGGTLRGVAGLEALAMAFFAFVSGVAAAAIANVAYVALANWRAPRGIVPFTLGSAGWVWSVAAILAVVLSIIVAIVPAYWASRVAPVAALKPVSEVTESEASRRVSVWWLAIPTALAAATPLVTSGWQPILRGQANAVATIVGVLCGFFLLLELFRTTMPLLGRWLTRRRAPWAIAAGIAVSARPRQYVAPAFVTMLAVVATAIVAASNLGNAAFVTTVLPQPADFTDPGWYIDGSYYAPAWIVTATLVATGVSVLTGLAIAVNNARASDGDDATQRALGLSRLSGARSAFVQFLVPQVFGIAVGALVGGALALSSPLRRAYDSAPAPDETYYQGIASIPDSLAALGITVAIALAVGTAGAAVFAATQSRPAAYPPIERGAQRVAAR